MGLDKSKARYREQKPSKKVGGKTLGQTDLSTEDLSILLKWLVGPSAGGQGYDSLYSADYFAEPKEGGAVPESLDALLRMLFRDESLGWRRDFGGLDVNPPGYPLEYTAFQPFLLKGVRDVQPGYHTPMPEQPLDERIAMIARALVGSQQQQERPQF